jgi:hypothetical protein
MNIAALRARRQAFAAEGLCSHCGAAAEEGRTLCADHLRWHRQRKKEQRAERRAAGLCVQCAALAAERRALCTACLERNRARRAPLPARPSRPPVPPEVLQRWHRTYVARKRAAGRCVRCGAPSPAGRWLCRDCSDEAAADATERRAARRAAGLCMCGRPPRPGRSLCEACAGAARRRTAAARAHRRDAGLCVSCPRPRDPRSRRFCPDHLAAHAALVRRLRRRRRGEVLREPLR